MLFYMLSLFTGVLECGWILRGVVQGFPLWQILCFPLAYHVGNLFPKPIFLGKWELFGMSAVSAALSMFMLFDKKNNFLLDCLCLLCLSACMQSVRSGLKSDGNRLLKRVFRVSGFLLALSAIYFSEWILLSFSVLMMFVILKNYNKKSGICRFHSQGGFSAVMLFHQLHYFFYAHITLATMAQKTGIIWAALLFCGTWITYMLTEPLVSKLTIRIQPVFYMGHTGICLLLFALYFVENMTLFTILWLVTGFGGGVVYTISERAKSVESFDKDSMTVSENIGHTSGLLTAVCISVMFGADSPKIMLLFGSASAFLAVITMFLISGKGNFYEINKSKG